ncbi:MAG: hypothetical protein F4Z48_02060, partial [Dehalococcoidia bacterium]|nr:hypothetical protein [Dehalococcoidia bacterium]
APTCGRHGDAGTDLSSRELRTAHRLPGAHRDAHRGGAAGGGAGAGGRRGADAGAGAFKWTASGGCPNIGSRSSAGR